MTILDDTPNHLVSIDEVYMFISSDRTGEGVCAAPLGNGAIMPMVAADKKRLDILMSWAREISQHSGKTIKLVKFTTRHEVMEITPQTAGMQ